MEELDSLEFHIFRTSPDFAYFNNSTNGQPIMPLPVQGNRSPRTPAEEFNKSFKLDPSSFPTFSEDKGYDQFERELTAIANSHGLLNILSNQIPSSTTSKPPSLIPQILFWPMQLLLRTCHQASHVQRLMSDKFAKTPAAPSHNGAIKAKKHEVLIDDQGNVYRLNKVNIVYSVNNNVIVIVVDFP